MTQTTAAVLDAAPEILDAFQFECDKQRRLHQELLADNFQIADDHAGLENSIGTVRDVECFVEMWTPRLLCKLFVVGTEEISHSFHLVPLHQLVKWGYVVPQPGERFSTKFVIGVRRVGDREFVPALRLPLK